MFLTLTEAGYETVIPLLPSCSNINAEDYPTRTLDDDSLAMTQEIGTLVEGHGKLVVMVMHSYGGVAGSNANPENLSYRKRREKAQKGGVIHLYYICGLILNEGESGQDTLTFLDEDDKANGVCCFRNAAKLLYSDLDYAEAALWESRIIPQPAAALWTRVARAAYRYIPSTYLVCENDVHMPPPFQEAFSSFAEAEVERCSAGHAPMLSQPDMLVQRISTAATRAMQMVSD
ncbi:alpha/beta hydrolase [Aspergillus melleus]|uniref:alpha/beta hydrolase n=1 Tax=Aspergillus melleus TaxID=138277 RepID=UPI001E8D605B|nr:uncharacterized protein LDX57_006919 [Aspergillus melleus]KAH8429252.1 hypothetical protein LDX57_006919 [Aspergillus melleus]